VRVVNVRVLILDNSLEPGLYGPVEHWSRHFPPGTDVRVFRAVDGDGPDDSSSYTHAIVTGSEASINGDERWILDATACVRRLALAGIPILASCFGHQMIVRALSGKSHVRSSATPEFGWVEIAWNEPGRTDDPVARALPSPAFSYSAHFDEVFDLPPDWVTLATTPRCPHAVIRWRDGPVWGFQHHPEIQPAEGRALYDEFLVRMGARRIIMESAFLPQVRDSFLTADLVGAFLAVSRG
jgi:GMP synthase-like glutamine amidotransferase